MAVRQEESTGTDAPTPEEQIERVQKQLYEAGLIREIKPPIIDHTPWQNRKPFPTRGRPLSEILIEERR